MRNFTKIMFIAAITCLWLIAPDILAQIPEWEWAKSEGGKSREVGHSITTDKNGDIIVAGIFEDTSISFDNIILDNNVNFNNVFVVKYNASGTVIWARSVSNINIGAANSVATDNEGNVFVTGSLRPVSSLTFADTILANENGYDAVLLKFDENGNEIWARSGTGLDDIIGSSVTVDKNGNSYVTGSFYGSIDNVFTFGDIKLYQTSAAEMFVVKYDPEGNVLWAKSSIAGGAFGHSISSDTIGNVYVTGTFNGRAKFDTLNITNDSIISYNFNVFIVKYDEDGNVHWATSSKGRSIVHNTSIHIDRRGDVNITGSFSSDSIVFGSTDLIHNKNDSAGIFIAKYDPNGNVLWARLEGGIYGDEAIAIVSDTNNNIYVTGSLTSPTIQFESTELKNNGVLGTDILIIKYNSSGELLWGASVGGKADERAMSIAVDIMGNIYLTGGFSSSVVNFGSVELGKNESVYPDMFIAKIGSPTTGVMQFVYESNVSLFPNPNNGILHLSSTGSGKHDISIYAIDGETVFEKSFFESNIVIDLSGKAKGIYIYQLQKEGKVLKTGKLVLE